MKPRTLLVMMLLLVSCGSEPEKPKQTPAPAYQQYLDKAAQQLGNKEFSEAAISAGIARDMAEMANDGPASARSSLILAQAWMGEGEEMKAAKEYLALNKRPDLKESEREQVDEALGGLEDQGVAMLESATKTKGKEAKVLVTEANKLFDLLKLEQRRVAGRKQLATLLLEEEDFAGAKLVLEEARKLAPDDKELTSLMKRTAPSPPPQAAAKSDPNSPNRQMKSAELFRAPPWLKGCWFLHTLHISGTGGGSFMYFREEGDVMWGVIVETQLLSSVRTDAMGREISRGIPFHRAFTQHNLKGKIDGKNYFFKGYKNPHGLSGYMKIDGDNIEGRMKFKKRGITKDFKGYRMDKPMEIDVKGKGTLVIPSGKT